ncbi:hypothetical protein ABBQ32_003642 [Trebouxia sp. C0010 RCD-2024]
MLHNEHTAAWKWAFANRQTVHAQKAACASGKVAMYIRQGTCCMHPKGMKHRLLHTYVQLCAAPCKHWNRNNLAGINPICCGKMKCSQSSAGLCAGEPLHASALWDRHSLQNSRSDDRGPC